MCADSDHENGLRLRWYCGAAGGGASSCARRPDMTGGPSGFAGTTGSAPLPGSSLLGAGVSGAGAGSGAGTGAGSTTGSPPGSSSVGRGVGAADGTRLRGGGRGLLAGIGPSGFAGTTGSAPAPGNSSVGACVFTFFDGDAVGPSVGRCLWWCSSASGFTASGGGGGVSVNPAPFSIVYGPFSNHIPTIDEHPGPPLSQITSRSGFVTVSRCFANQKK
jgi:hypothetical protein